MLAESSRHFGVPESAISRLSLLAKGEAVAVVTGQQVGYLGGPLYTYIKAYHTIRLAAELESQLDLAVLPIFWLEGEDHDFEEIREARYLDRDGVLRKFRVTPEAEIPNLTAGSYLADAAADVAMLSEQLGNADAQAIALLGECYDGGSLSDAMGKLLARTLGGHGLLLVEGMNRELKTLAQPLWEKITALGQQMTEILQHRSAEVERAGYPTPIHPTPGAHLFYLIDDEQCRVPVNYHGETMIRAGSRSRLTADQLPELARLEPWRVSPKAALRAIYQDFVLPTIAYVAGPGEFNYHMQVAPYYQTLGVVPPSLFPRLSVTIEDGKSARMREKLNLTVERVLSEPAADLTKSLLRESDETHAAEKFREARREIEEIYNRLKVLVREIDPTLEGLVTSSAGKSLQPVDHLREKTDKALKQRHAMRLAKLERLLNVLHPNGSGAERVLCTGYYFARFGVERINSALQALPSEPMRHWVVTIE